MTYDDQTQLPNPDDFTPPPWWADEVQAVVSGVVDPDPVSEAAWKATEEAPPHIVAQSDDLSPRERSARRLAAIAALEKLLAKLKAQEKAADGVWTRAGQKETVSLPDGTELGHVRTDKAGGAWKVADAGEWLAFVAKHHPDRVTTKTVQVVDPTYTRQVLASLNSMTGGEHPEPIAAGEWADPDTGEVRTAPPGLVYVPAGFTVVVVPDKGAPAAVERFLGPVAQQLGLPQLEA